MERVGEGIEREGKLDSMERVGEGIKREGELDSMERVGEGIKREGELDRRLIESCLMDTRQLNQSII